MTLFETDHFELHAVIDDLHPIRRLSLLPWITNSGGRLHLGHIVVGALNS